MEMRVASAHAAPETLFDENVDPLDAVERLLREVLREAVESGRLVFANEFERRQFLLVLVDLRVLAVERRGVETIITLSARACFALDCRVRHVPRLVATLSMLGDSTLTVCCAGPAAHRVWNSARQRLAWSDWSLARDTANRRGVAAPLLVRYVERALRRGDVRRRAEAE
jgi:hypothetical protein